MRIVTILGSPRRKGNTATVLGLFEERVAPDHQVERIDIIDYQVHGCLGCDACQKVVDRPGCRQKDDALAIFDRVLAADVIVYATPLYAWSFSSQLKALIDRHFCLVKWGHGDPAPSLLHGKRAALLVTCADAVENNADLIPIIFERQMQCLQSETIGHYVVPNCTTPEEIGDRGARIAAEMARDICGQQGRTEEREPGERWEEILVHVRDMVSRMRPPGESEALDTLVQRALQELAVPFHACGVNPVDPESGPPPGMSPDTSAAVQWSEDRATREMEVIYHIWQRQEVTYRRDLRAEDPYGESSSHAEAYGAPVRSIIDVPFSHGTLAVNSTEPDAFSEGNIMALQALASALSEGYQRRDRSV